MARVAKEETYKVSMGVKENVAEVTLTGRSPLLMHNIAGYTESGSMKGPGETYTPEKDARAAAYMMENEEGAQELYVPAICIYQAVINAAKQGFKVKNKGSAARVLAGNMRVEPAMIGLGTDKYEIDVRAVRIQSARIMRARPRIDNWKISFQLFYDARYVKGPYLRQILEEAGRRVGIMDYRPQKMGPFGTFNVERFEEANGE